MSALPAILALVSVSGADGIGWNNDGSANFPDANPPCAFDGGTGVNLKWKAKLPNWSNASPIVVTPSGGTGPARVFCLSEPLDYAPVLHCFDADTGKEFWKRTLDPVPHLPKGEQDAARALATKQWALQRARKALISEMEDLAQKNKSAWQEGERGAVPQQASEAAAPLMVRAKEIGVKFRGLSYSAGGYPQHFEWVNSRDPDLKRLTDLGLMYSDWDTQGTWDGVAYPSPVSDGRLVYTITAHNLYSCHDLDGKVVWEVRFPPADMKSLTDGERARIVAGLGERDRWPGGWPGAGHFSTSPLLCADRLVSAAGRMMRALDATSGREIWRLPMVGAIGQCMGVPGIVRVGGDAFVIGVDREGRRDESVDIVRLKDGMIAGKLPAVTCSKGSITGPCVLGDGSVVAYSTGAAKSMDVVSWTLAMDSGGTVSASERWRTQGPRYFGLWRPAWRGTEMFSGQVRFDAAVGKPIGADMRKPFKGGSYDGAQILAGPYFVQCGFYAGTFAFFEINSGKLAGTGKVPVNPEDGLSTQLKREQAARSDWRWLCGGTPFAYKNRFYVRAYDFLWCFDRPASEPDADKQRGVQ